MLARRRPTRACDSSCDVTWTVKCQYDGKGARDNDDGVDIQTLTSRDENRCFMVGVQYTGLCLFALV